MGGKVYHETFLDQWLVGVAEYESELVILHLWYSKFSWKNTCKKVRVWKRIFIRTEIDFLNIAKFQNIFLCSEKTESRNNYFHTCTFHYIAKIFWNLAMFKKSISVLINFLQIFFHENLEYQKCKITSSDSYSATPKMCNINVFQSCWVFVQVKKIKKRNCFEFPLNWMHMKAME